MTQERETIERQREDLEQEKARMSSVALRLKTRTQEVEAFSEVRKRRFHSSPQRRRRVGVSDILRKFSFFAVFAARGREARGGRAGAAGGEAAGGRAQGPARQHPRPDGAAAAAGAANPAGRCSATFQESQSHLRSFILLYEVRQDPQQEAFLSVNTQERMRFSHVQKETERSRPDPPVTSSPVAPGDVKFWFVKSIFPLDVADVKSGS